MITKEIYDTKIIKINKPIRNHRVGDMVPAKFDKFGTPIDRYWRDRFKDAKIDKCVELSGRKEVKPEKQNKKTSNNSL